MIGTRDIADEGRDRTFERKCKDRTAFIAGCFVFGHRTFRNGQRGVGVSHEF